MNRLLTGAVQYGYAASLLPAWRRFADAAANPREAQLRKLHAIVRDNAACCFGRQHRFERVRDVDSFRSEVPIARFDDLAPWVERISRGEPAVLTRAPIRMLERTSGSTSANKLVPFTDGLLEEISGATYPWIFDLLRGIPSLRSTRSYWSISPVGRARERSEGGIPIGMDDDTEYFGPFARRILGRMMVVPASVARIQSLDRWRWETCRNLVLARDLGLISVWSPTFLSRLMEAMARELDDLLESVPAERAAEIRAARERNGGELTGEVLWPRLGVVSCWADGPSRGFLPAIQRWFPRTRIQPKGLLATEGVVSFPLLGVQGSVLAVASHFLEFLDLEAPARTPLLAHELRVGAAYSPVLTTSGGLYRYHLQDVVRCVGRWRAAPLVRFEGRLDFVSDLAGEKLDARVVGKALEAALSQTPGPWGFAMIAPKSGPRIGYRLYVESPRDDAPVGLLAEQVERELCAGAHYSYCRKLGQLEAVEAVRVRDGAGAIERRRAAEGGKVGDVKPSPLDRRMGWEAWFTKA